MHGHLKIGILISHVLMEMIIMIICVFQILCRGRVLSSFEKHSIGIYFSETTDTKIKIQNLRIYISGQNLFTITNYSGADPEIGQLSSTDYLSRGFDYGTYPQSRTITGGLNLTF